MWKEWIGSPPPRDEIVECRRLNVGEDELSFWVKPELLSPFWNVCGVIWRPLL